MRKSYNIVERLRQKAQLWASPRQRRDWGKQSTAWSGWGQCCGILRARLRDCV